MRARAIDFLIISAWVFVACVAGGLVGIGLARLTDSLSAHAYTDPNRIFLHQPDGGVASVEMTDAGWIGHGITCAP